MAFFILDIGFKLIWDQTGMNADLLKFNYDDAKVILTTRGQ